MKKGYRIIVLLMLALVLVFTASCTAFKTSEKGESQKVITTIDARYGLNTNEVENYDNISSSDVATVVANIVMPATVEITATSSNGKQAKASYEVSVGDVIEISFGNKIVKAKVIRIATTLKDGELIEVL